MEHHHKPRFVSDCTITANDEVVGGQFRMHFDAPDIAAHARPGQFLMLQVARGLYPFLRRPMCFERIREGAFSILYKVEGEGTRLLSQMAVGQTLNVQGPLGNGFSVEPGFERHVIVAGGIGVACFPALADALTAACGKAPEVILAARTKDLLICEREFSERGCAVHVVTDDGSAGMGGFASDMLSRLEPTPATRVYVCGPMIMMKTCSEVAMTAGASCLVSLEAQMACGDGACLGCVVESKLEKEGEKMVRVCADGPVFDTTIIDWEAHNLAYDR